MIQIIPLGGYGEIGKNMTAVRIDNEIVLLDMGIHLTNYIAFTEDEDARYLKAEELRDAEAIPDDTLISQWKNHVKAIIPSHAHLDHIGAIPFLANGYRCPIICTRFTSEVIKKTARQEGILLKNRIEAIDENGSYAISHDIRVEFINVTHSTPQTVIIALHTKYGSVLYANDFKFDDSPVIGKKPNYGRLKEIGKGNVIALICDSLYAQQEGRMPSESDVEGMMKETMLHTDFRKRALIITTFSSHIARLHSIIGFCRKLKRKAVFLGRSLSKYTEAAEKAKVASFSKDVEIVKFSKNIKRKLRLLQRKKRDSYALIVTGHQGEPRATLSKMANGMLPFRFEKGDYVIFSCKTIPSQPNIENRRTLEQSLKKQGVLIIKDIHASGHAAQEDSAMLIRMLKPKHLVPAHSEMPMMQAFRKTAMKLGYSMENVHLLGNGEMLELD